MPKAMNTNKIIDKNAFLLQDLYEDRMEINPMKAYNEMRMYHLPPYFRQEKRSGQTISERRLMFLKVRGKKKGCEHCGRVVDLIDTYCMRCLSTYTSLQMGLDMTLEPVPKYEEPLETWASPKAILLAAELGCTLCGKKYIPKWFWHDPDFGWDDGLCPDCIGKIELRSGYWSYLEGANHSSARYDKCVTCGENNSGYELWGMCSTCYVEWQDSYLDPEKILSLAAKYGPLSTLLIRTDLGYLSMLSSILPVKRTQPRVKSNRFQELGGPLPKRPVRTLADVGINVNEIILSRD